MRLSVPSNLNVSSSRGPGGRPLRLSGSPGGGIARRAAGASSLLLVALAGFSLSFLLAEGVAAQVTTRSDADPPPDGSLRFEVDASSAGDTIDFQLETTVVDEASIPLRSPLVFDNTVTLDNSDTAFDPVDVRAPPEDAFFEVQDGVSLTLRDIGLLGNANNTDDVIDLQGASTQLTIDSDRADQTINPNITGLGSLVKEGPASLTLGGANSFSGGITIRQGDLVGTTGSLANGGTAPINLAADGAGIVSRAVFDIGSGDSDFLDGTSPSFIDSSSNGGSAFFVKRGEGTFDVNFGVLAASIGIVVEEGLLLAGDTTLAGGRSFEIQSDATLRINSGFASNSSGRIAGDGTLELTATSLALTGDLTAFTGTLAASAGPAIAILTIDPDTPPASALPFDIVLDADTPASAQLLVVDDDDIVLSGNISGNGLLQKTGAGTTTLTGIATHTGGTVISTGTLVGNTENLRGTVTVADAATLAIDQPTNGTFAATIVPTGTNATVRKFGPGVLTFDSNQTFPGSLTLEAGGLRFSNGAGLTNADLIAGVGLPAGSVRLDVDFNPLLPPSGNTVAIGGDLTIGSGARLGVNLDDGNPGNGNVPTHTVFASSGNVSIATGAELAVGLQPGQYTGNPTFDVVTGAGGLTGDFTILQDFLFFDITGAAAGNVYQLTVSPNSQTFENFASTYNQSVSGSVLDDLRAMGSGGDPALERLLNELNVIEASEVGPTLEEVSPDDLTATTNIRLAAAQRTWRSLSNRMALHRDRSIGTGTTRESRQDRARRLRRERLERRERRSSLERRPSSETDPRPGVDAAPPSSSAQARPAPAAKPWVAWFEGSGTLGSLDASDEKAYDYATVGPILGADAEIVRNLRVGFATAGTYSEYDVEDNDNDGESWAVEATAYAAWLGDPLQALLAFRYSHSWIETDRRITLTASADRVDGDFEGDDFGVYGELSRAFGDPSLVEVTPIVSIAYHNLRSDDFNEDGASPLRFQANEQEIDSAQTSVGFRLAAARTMQDGFVLRPRFKALWNHEWADVERNLSGRFPEFSAPVRFEGAEIPRDHGEVALGWEVGYGPNANLFLGWDGRFGEDLIENSLEFGVRVAW